MGKSSLLTNHFYGIGPAATLTSGDYVHVVIENPEKDDTFVFMRSSANDGASFGPVVNPTSGDSVANPRVVVSGSNLFAVWSGNFVSEGSGAVVTFAKSTDNGATWSYPVLIDPQGLHARIA